MWMGRTNGRHARLLLGNLQGRICIQRRKTLLLREQKPDKRDVNLQGQEEKGVCFNTNSPTTEYILFPQLVKLAEDNFL